MININVLARRQQRILLGVTVLILTAAVAGGWFLSSAGSKKQTDMKQGVREPAPDMTGVVNTTFDDKVQRQAITETQAAGQEIRREMAALRKELGLISRDRKTDQDRIARLEEENRLLQTPPEAFSVAPAEEPVPSHSSSGNPPFYPGTGGVPPVINTFTPLPPHPGMIDATAFSYTGTSPRPAQPYIPSGSFARAIVIEGADANAAVTGSQNTSPVQFRLTGKVQMPNDREVDLTGCFVSAEAYGDVSSERAEVRTRSLSCHRGDAIIDQKIAGHVAFMGKNGIKGQVVMRNGKILGWAFGAGFVDGIGRGIEKAGSPQPGIGAVASMGARDIAQSGFGGGASQAARTLSDYYIKRAEQYHPVIPIGAGNEVTVVFQDGFRLETIEEALAKKNRTALSSPPSPEQVFSTRGMLDQLKDFRPGDPVHPPGQ